MIRSRSLLFLAVGCCLLWSSAACAQDSAQQEKSLGEVAREAKKSPTPKAKIVVTDDSNTLKSHPNPIPAIFKDGLDNSDDILAAILDYKAKHNEDETAAAVKAWYDENDSRLKDAIVENARIESAVRPPYSTPEQYKAIVAERLHDLQLRRENGLLMARIQNTFIKVRNGLIAHGMKYPWFKIRCGNGNCSF
jgi:hypothetical protein